MRFTAYQETHPTPFPWLSPLPAHWQFKRLKHCASLVNKKVEVGAAVDLPYTGLEHIESWTGRRLSDPGLMTESEGQTNLFAQGDVLFCKLRPYLAKALRPESSGVCTGELLVLRPVQVDQSFLFYFMLSRDTISMINASTYGAKMPRANWDFIGNLPTSLPPLPEQKAIATFLDRETERINSLIAKKQKQIELLQRKRAALISQAVTKGLDPNAKMKDSGVEWLGKVPENWPVERLRFHAYINPSKSESFLHPELSVSFVPMEDLCVDGGINLDKTKLVAEVSTGYTYFRDGDVIFAKITPCFENGKCSIASSLHNGFAFGTTELHVLRPKKTLILPFLFYIVSCHPFRKIGESYMYGAGGQKRVPDDFIRDFRFSIPPLFEQSRIVAYLDQQCAHIATLSSKLHLSITKLIQYRTALISAAVTGKIDVSTGLNTGVRQESEVVA